jgi:hypothetical protein
MGYLDYTPPKAWGGLGSQGQGNLLKIADLLQEQRRTAAYEDQIAATNKALAEKALKDKTDEALKQSDRLKDITAGATAYLAKGRRGAAEALVKSSQFPNPRDPGGPLLGMTWEEEKPGPAPTPTAVAPEEPLPDFVQVMTPQQARTKAIHDALVKQGRPVDQPPAANDLATEAAATEAEGLAQRTQDARQQYPAKKALYESEAAADAAKKKAYDEQVANPNVILGSPYGGRTTIHPSEERDYQRQDMIDRATKLFADAAKEPDPHTRATMLRSANLLMDEIPNFEKSAINNTASASQAQEGRVELQGLKGQNAIDVANIRKKKGGPAPLGPGNKSWEKEEAGLVHEIDKFETNSNLSGPKGLQGKQTALGEAYTHAQKPNVTGAQQILILDRLLKSASGLGVRQAMMQTYLNHLSGLREKGENVLQSYIDGSIGKGAWAKVVEAIHDELADSWAEGGASNKRFQEVIHSSDAYKRHPDLVRRRELQMYGGLHGFGQPEGEPAADPESAPVTKAKTIAKGAKAGVAAPPAKQEPAAGKRIKLKSGETGTLGPDGIFHPDGK